MRTSRQPVGGQTVEVLQAGIGQRPLLLCHGFTGAKEDFAGVIDDLAERGWHAVAPDLPGHGRSDHPDDPAAYGIDAFVDVLLGVAGDQGWDRFVLLGHSMGGAVAQRLAVRSPEALRGLILMNAPCGPLETPRRPVETAVRVVEAGGIEALVELRRGRDDPTATEAHRRLLAERPGYAEFVEAKLMRSSPVMYARVLPELLDLPSMAHDLGDLDVPTLVLVGDQDTPFIDAADSLVTAIPKAAVVVVRDAGHSPQFENPVGWWNAVGPFLDELALVVT